MNTHLSPTTQTPTPAQTQPTAPFDPNLSSHCPPADPAQPAPAQQSKPLQPWDLQPGESAKAFDAFQRFLALGPEATVGDLASPDGSDYEALKKLGTRHHWRERAAAHRQHQARLQSEPLEKAITESSALFSQRAQVFNQQQWEFTQLLTDLGYEAVQQVRNAKLPTPRLDELSRTFSTIARLGRQSFELPAHARPRSSEFQSAVEESQLALKKTYASMAAEGAVTNVHDQINRERTLAQPAEPPTTPPAAPDISKTP